MWKILAIIMICTSETIIFSCLFETDMFPESSSLQSN